MLPPRLASILFLLSTAQSWGQTPALPNFSGTWLMDAHRSESAHQDVAIGPVTLVISQTPNEIMIDTTRTDGKGSGVFREKLTYLLDGTETIVSGNEGAKVTTKARWDGGKLVTETTRNIHDSTVTTLYVQSLAPGGREMTIQKSLTVQHGYQFEGSKTTGRGTDVFVKKEK